MKITRVPKTFRPIGISFTTYECELLWPLFETLRVAGGGWHQQFADLPDFLKTRVRELWEIVHGIGYPDPIRARLDLSIPNAVELQQGAAIFDKLYKQVEATSDEGDLLERVVSQLNAYIAEGD